MIPHFEQRTSPSPDGCRHVVLTTARALGFARRSSTAMTSRSIGERERGARRGLNGPRFGPMLTTTAT
jgi:hypothetical protein